MVKFVHKRHMNKGEESGKIVIYYNVSDIFLGVALLALVVFFINDYLSHRPGFYREGNSDIYESPNSSAPFIIKTPTTSP